MTPHLLSDPPPPLLSLSPHNPSPRAAPLNPPPQAALVLTHPHSLLILHSFFFTLVSELEEVTEAISILLNDTESVWGGRLGWVTLESQTVQTSQVT